MNCKRFLALLLVLIVILGLLAGCTKPDADAGGEPEVEPAVDFSQLRNVMVITYFAGQTNLGGEK